MTVLFADLVGFTPFAEARDAEDVRETLGHYFELARDVIERYGGAVEKFIGDAVMAVWGAPTAHEDDAERAVRAALDLADRVGTLGPGIRARCGVLTGEAAVTIGAVGQGMVAGDLVNTAARLQGVAEPGTVLVGEATMRAASAAVTFEAAGTHELKGKTAPVRAWRAVDVVAQRGGQGRAEGLEPPFVGREDELRLLKDALHATGRDQRVRLVSITGPAGIGKSRLAWEVEKYIDGVVEPIYWHRGRSPSYGEGVAFWALGEMVRRRAGLVEGDDDEATRTAIGRTVAEFVDDEEDRRWVEPALLALLGVEPPPAGGRDALFAGWRIFFERVARQGTAVLLFEDLHWADSGLLDFVDHLVDWSKGAPILVITLARPELIERRPEWGAGKRHFTAVALEPLSGPLMRELLERLVPGLPDETTATILTRADGVPLYAVETVRMLVAEGRLVRDDDVYRPVGDLTALAVPESLRSLVAARLDGLGPDDRRLLQDASVLGRTFSSDAVAAIAGPDRGTIDTRLRALVRRELLELEADPRSPERGQYGFVQALIREVAYDTLSRRDRRSRHLAAARYFEALGDDELAGVLASHYLAAHSASAEGAEADAVAAQARIALRGAADRAAALGGNEQAMGYLQQALSITTGAADRAELLERGAVAADALGRYDTAQASARDAVEAYREAGDAAGVGRATELLGIAYIDGGHQSEAVEVLERAVRELPEEHRAGQIEAGLLTQLSRALMRASDYPRTVEVADAALAIADPSNFELLVAEAMVNKASALDSLGRWRESSALMEAAIRTAHESGFYVTELRAINNYGTTLASVDPHRGIAMARAALELARKIGNRTMSIWLAGSIGFYSYLPGDDWDAALAIADEELAHAESPFDRHRLSAVAGILRVARGAPSGPILAELDALRGGIEDPQFRAGEEVFRSDAALAAGDHAGAYAAALRGIDFVPAWAPNLLPLALRAALWDRDPERVAGIARRLDAAPAGDRLTVQARTWAGAVVAGLQGRHEEAVDGFRRADEMLREVDLAFERARSAIDVVIVLGPADAYARAAADAARPVLAALGARPYLERLDAELARPPSVDAARSDGHARRVEHTSPGSSAVAT